MNDLKIPITKVKVRDAADIYEIMRIILTEENRLTDLQEHCWAIALDKTSKILNIELIGIGSVDMVIVKPMDVLRVPVLKAASSIVLVHNHPSNTLKPSEGDKNVTDRMIWACRIMEMQLIDHIIITENSYFSFAESGLMDDIKKNSNFIVPYLVEEEMREKMNIDLEKKMFETKKKYEKKISKTILDIAKKLISQGRTTTEIVEATSLSEEEVNNLIEKLNKK